MKAAVKYKIQRVNAAIGAGTPPEKDENKCTYCMFKGECKAVDAGNWENPKESTSKAKKISTEAKTAPTVKIKKAIQKQEAAYQAKIEHEVDMEAMDARRDW